MKYRKFIIYCLCIIGISSIIGIKLYLDKNKAIKNTSLVNDSQKAKTTKEAANTKSSEELKAAVSSSGTISSYAEVSKLDITMEGTTPNTEGNSSGNLANQGYFAEQGKWMYFTLTPLTNTAYPIYRAMKDGETGLKAITGPGSFYCINVIGDWVYYIGSSSKSSPSINRTKTDGSVTEQLLDVLVFSMYIRDGYIYYVTPDGENTAIYKLKLNAPKGDKGELIAKGANFASIYVTNNLIYTTIQQLKVTNNTTGVGEVFTNLYTMSLDGSNLKKINNDNLYNFIIYNNYIYYFNIDNQRLYRMNLNGTNKVQIFSNPITSYNVYNNNIYFSGATGDDNNIFKSNLDGKDIVKLTHNSYLNNKQLGSTAMDNIYNISIIDDSIFYFGTGNTSRITSRVKIDGSLEKQID